jgi:DnaJ-class molecular chaperone
MKDYYKLLGIPRDATSDKIKKAYKAKLLQYHPDTNHGDAKAHQLTQEIVEAGGVLTDARKKLQYDQKLLQYEKQRQEGSSSKQHRFRDKEEFWNQKIETGIFEGMTYKEVRDGLTSLVQLLVGAFSKAR